MALLKQSEALEVDARLVVSQTRGAAIRLLGDPGQDEARSALIGLRDRVEAELEREVDGAFIPKESSGNALVMSGVAPPTMITILEKCLKRVSATPPNLTEVHELGAGLIELIDVFVSDPSESDMKKIEGLLQTASVR